MHQDSYQEKKKKFTELLRRSERAGIFVFTDFLSPSSAAPAYDAAQERMLTVWGGANGCERVIVRFGDPNELGYEEPFPIVCLQIEPLQKKFSDSLTHRDFLGAMMNLGIERDTIGDVIVKENQAWVFALPHIAELILRELYQVKHTQVKCSVVDELPQEAAHRLEELELVVPSLRPDVIAAKLCHLSREKAKKLFSSGQVLINGRICEKENAGLHAADVIVIRGYGKYIFDGETRKTGKGNPVVRIRRYV
jgi:RNA-binding protein YlmH